MKPLKLISVILMLVVTFVYPIDIRATQLINSETINKIDRYLFDSVENGFSGTVLISEQKVIKLNKGNGYANRAEKIANQPKTIFDIGSNTKQFTAAAIMLLAEQEKLSLSDNISDFFSNVPTDKRSITIHQLLIHTSGLPEAIGRDFDDIVEQEFFQQVFNSQLLFPVGSEYSYSNIGYSVLAKIIEIVSKQSYEQFLHQHLFMPAGMHSTGYLLPKWQRQEKPLLFGV